MTGLLGRLRRLLRQNAIRLSAPDRPRESLRSGDRLAFGSRWWRVRSPAGETAGDRPSIVEIVTEDAPRRSARIRLPDASGVAFFEEVGDPVPFRWREVLHLPAGSSAKRAGGGRGGSPGARCVITSSPGRRRSGP